MKFLGTAVLLGAALAAGTLSAQSDSHDLGPPPAQDAPTPSAPAAATPHGQVIFSRSMDENGQTVDSGPGTPPANLRAAGQGNAEDWERDSITLTSFDMDVRLQLQQQRMSVRALVTVRNDGNQPLRRVPLQISSSLGWERIRTLGRDVLYTVSTLNSDADHTGQLHEAVVPLAEPLTPGASQQFDLTYSGAIAFSAQRLIAIGTPEQVALHSDWDRISVPFTGIRGFGNVLWYPTASVPVVLGDGARLFDEMGEHKERLAGAQFRLRLTVEFPHGQAPNIALVNGHPVPLSFTTVNSVGPEVDGVATAQLDTTPLGFEAPSLFVARGTAHPGANTTLWTTADDEVNAGAWVEASSRVTPFLQQWLGQKPRAQLIVLDLPDAADASFETGALLATSIRQATSDQLDDILAHALTHAWMQSPRAWLSEGVAHFMGTLWIERSHGRQRALESMEASRGALALAEPSSPGMGAGQPLSHATSPIYYRTKATYVLWMLRDLVGDQALSAALRAYNPADDVSAGYGRDTRRSSFEKLVEQASDRADLSWFFNDWVNADMGLPELSVDGVFPTTAKAGNWLVSVNVTNNGYAAAEIPITVRSDTASVTQRVLVPARGKASQRLLIQTKPTEVQVNDGTVPETEASVHVTPIADSVNPPAAGR